MRAGRLRHRGVIEEKAVSRDAYGAEAVTWTEVATGWMGVERVGGREWFQAQGMQAEVTARLRMRYRAGVRPEMRVRVNGHTYDIVTVIDVQERGRELEVMVREIQ